MDSMVRSYPFFYTLIFNLMRRVESAIHLFIFWAMRNYRYRSVQHLGLCMFVMLVLSHLNYRRGFLLPL